MKTSGKEESQKSDGDSDDESFNRSKSTHPSTQSSNSKSTVTTTETKTKIVRFTDKVNHGEKIIIGSIISYASSDDDDDNSTNDDESNNNSSSKDSSLGERKQDNESPQPTQEVLATESIELKRAIYIPADLEAVASNQT